RCAGTAAEKPLAAAIAGDPLKLADLIHKLNVLADYDCTVGFLPPWPGTRPEYEKIQRQYAQFALLFDRHLVAYDPATPRYDWITWPQFYGPPIGPIVQSGLKVSRAFAGGTMEVDFGAA